MTIDYIREELKMTIVVTGYNTKKDLKAAIGQRLQYQCFGLDRPPPENGKKIVVANRPHITGRGREFFALVDLENGLIAKVV